MKTIKTIEQAKKEAFKKLRKLFRQKRPGERPPTYKDDTANGLTRCIIDYINLKGYQAERINCIGTPIPVGDNLFRFGKTTMDTGTADVSATIKKLSVKIEVKVGTDTMKKDQWEYKSKIEKAGGVYLIARSFPNFLIALHQKIRL